VPRCSRALPVSPGEWAAEQINGEGGLSCRVTVSEGQQSPPGDSSEIIRGHLHGVWESGAVDVHCDQVQPQGLQEGRVRP
jgi:hypothetical protein